LILKLSRELRFCEVLAIFRVKEEDAINKIRQMNIKEVPELKDLLGEYSLVGFRIGSKNTLPTQNNWFDIEVHPTWANPNKFFDIAIVYRNESEDNVISFAKKLEKVVLCILQNLF